MRQPRCAFGVEVMNRLFVLLNESSEAPQTVQSADMDTAAAAKSIAELKTEIGKMDQGQRLYIFKVFIEYPLNLGSGCISMFSVNLTFDKTLMMQFCYFSAKITTF